MKVLILSGAFCTIDIWKQVKEHLCEIDVTYVSYPHDMLQQANQIEDISKWLYQTYSGPYDAVIGHSMGGIIALDVATRYDGYTNNVIFIESSLVPANEFYRNLMTPLHIQQYGEAIQQMMQAERPYYTKALLHQIQGVFDYQPLVRNCLAKVYGIYGDHGVAKYSNRYSDLNVSQDVLEQVSLSFIADSCHMPMIENAEALAKQLIEIFTA